MDRDDFSDIKQLKQKKNTNRFQIQIYQLQMDSEQALTYTPCPTVFCGCQTMGNPYSTETQVNVNLQVYILLVFVIIIIFGGVRLGMQWFIFKDYYPLKQKSPILCILLILSICGQILIYPILYITNYLTDIFVDESARLKFRSIQSGLQFSVFIIYLVRCMRISYAHDTHSSRSKSIAFKIFQRQYFIAFLIGFIGLVKALVVVLDNYNDQESEVGNRIKDFALSVQLQTPVLNQSHLSEQSQFIWRSIVTGFFWNIVLTYCMWLHKSVNDRYSMKNQLLLVLIADLTTSLFNILLLGKSIISAHNQSKESQTSKPILNQYCQYSYIYPTTQLIRMINLLLVLWISIIKPLTQKKIYHVLLPTGRHYGFIKTMRDFLMEQQFLRVFTHYLKYMDEGSEKKQNTILLQFWKKMIVIKLDRRQREIQKLESIKNLVQSVESILFQDQSQLIINLKDSIVGLQQSLINSEIVKQKYRQSINEKVDQLQKMALERLDKIYMRNYSKTQSYYHLKAITDDYKRVNLNMIMLNLALIVDSENQFN